MRVKINPEALVVAPAAPLSSQLDETLRCLDKAGAALSTTVEIAAFLATALALIEMHTEQGTSARARFVHAIAQRALYKARSVKKGAQS